MKSYDKQNLVALYHSFSPFKRLDLKIIKILHIYAEKLELSRREYLIKETDEIGGLYMLTNGSVRVTQHYILIDFDKIDLNESPS